MESLEEFVFHIHTHISCTWLYNTKMGFLTISTSIVFFTIVELIWNKNSDSFFFAVSRLMGSSASGSMGHMGNSMSLAGCSVTDSKPMQFPLAQRRKRRVLFTQAQVSHGFIIFIFIFLLVFGIWFCLFIVDVDVSCKLSVDIYNRNAFVSK